MSHLNWRQTIHRQTRRRQGIVLMTATLILILSACAVPVAPIADSTATPEIVPHDAPTGDSSFPVTIENCDLTTTYDAPPQRAVTMNQAATEIMLALGLEDQMVGTAYLDDAILPQYESAYASIPILSDNYPSQEVLFGVEPDFVYGVYRSAFNDEAAGSRAELAELGIASYLSVCATLRGSSRWRGACIRISSSKTATRSRQGGGQDGARNTSEQKSPYPRAGGTGAF